MIKAVQVTEKVISSPRGGGISYFNPYTEADRGDFKILWPKRIVWKPEELEAMIRLFGTGFIIVDEEGNELRRMP